MHKGSCQCGGVSFEITGELRPVVACHCSQCRKTSGHFWAATTAPSDNIEIQGYTYLKWFRASPTARRGFCCNCGSSMFWHEVGTDEWSIAAGCFDTELPALSRHIHTASKGSYYEIADGLPQEPEE